MSEGDRERLLALIGCVRGAVIEVDGEGRYLDAWVDEPAKLAAPVEELRGRTVLEVLGAEKGAPLLERVLRVHRSGVAERHEYDLVIDGERRWFLTDFKRVPGAAGGHTVVLFRHDVTERRAAEDALRASEERYRLATRATQDLLYDLDIPTGVIVWNEAVARTFGRPSPTITEWLAAIHPDDRPRLATELQRVFRTDTESWQATYRIRKVDGTWAELLDRGFVARDPQGKARRLVGSLTDVTAQNRLQARLVQADRLVALGTLAAGVGHEINNPLCFVLGNLDHALEAGPFATSDADRAAEADARAALVDAREGALRIGEIVKSLRLFANDEGAPPDLATVDLAEVAEHALTLLEADLRGRARVVRVHEGAPLVRGRADHLGRICLSLLLNALEAIPAGAPDAHEVRIGTLRDPEGRAVLTVADDGVGIAPEALGRIFDPFFTTKPPGAGLGIGLSVSLALARAMGGTVAVTSQAGATSFRLVLPAAPATAPPAPMSGHVRGTEGSGSSAGFVNLSGCIAGSGPSGSRGSP